MIKKVLATTDDDISTTIHSAKRIAIFGAGIIAQHAYLLLKQLVDSSKFLGFWVSSIDSNGFKNNMTSSMYHEAIHGLNETPIPKDTLVIVCVSAKYKEEIADILNRQPYEILSIYLSEHLVNQLFKIYYKRYFGERKIDITSEVLQIPSLHNHTITLKNPFFAPMRDQNSCFTELGTIILPFCMGELRMCSETPYEYGPVSLSSFHNGIVFDLGANQGYFSITAASLGHTVYSFEPSSRLIKNLQSYSKLYNDFIHVEEIAISDKDGSANLYIDDHSDSSNSLVLQTNSSSNTSVKTTTIDSYRKKHDIRHINFIKADIEGAERYMLMGAKETLQECAPMLSICTYHLPDDPEVLQDLILSYNPNYKIIQKEKKLYAYVPTD